jgi:hypothetical protein
MSDKKFYSHKNQIVQLTMEEVIVKLYACEKLMRTTGFTYLQQQAFQSQIEEIKAWPEEVRNSCRDAARQFAGQGNQITLAVVRKAILKTCRYLAEQRAKRNSSNIALELRRASAENALATLFGKAPCPAIIESEIPVSRKYQDNGKLIRVKSTSIPKRLVVNVSEIESAEIYVLALALEDTATAMLLGYATKDDLKKAKCGDKTTSPEDCSWRDRAYYIQLENLRPMGELYKESNLKEIPSGISMERLPKFEDFPVARKDLKTMTQGQSSDEFDFLASVGLSPEKTKLENPPALLKAQSDEL